MTAAVSTTKTERSRADQTRIWRRDQRSMNTPANGPISEYGRVKTADAAAPAAGLGNVLPVENTPGPTPAVGTPPPLPAPIPVPHHPLNSLPPTPALYTP